MLIFLCKEKRKENEKKADDIWFNKIMQLKHVFLTFCFENIMQI